MTGKTHMVGGLALATTSSFLLHICEPTTNTELIKWGLTFATPALIGALAPDLDHWNSTAANFNIFTKILSIFIRILCGHRGLLHSPFFVIVLTGLFGWLYNICPLPWIGNMMTGFLIGYVSHLILDLLNPKGLPLLFPFTWEDGRPKKYPFFSFKQGGFLEFLLFCLLFSVTAIMIYEWMV